MPKTVRSRATTNPSKLESPRDEGPQEENQVAGLPAALEYLVLGAILVSAILFPLETLPSLSSAQKIFLKSADSLIVTLFSVEYLLRIWLSPRKAAYIFSFYGMVDLFAILPFYFAPAFDLRTLRLVRFIRLVRILKIVRYSKALQRFGRALFLAREEFAIFSSISFLTIYLSAVGIFYFERSVQPHAFGTVFDCLWWAVSTLTTVGYGDIYPVTAGGRLFTFVILMLGLGLVAIPAGVISSALTSVRSQEFATDWQDSSGDL